MENQNIVSTIDRKKQERVRIASICRVMNWSEGEYRNFMFETGVQYLELYLPDDAFAVRQLSGAPIFWAWWSNHWAERDDNYLRKDRVAYSYEDRNEYTALHNPADLVSSIYPGRVVLEESYASMIGELLDNAVKQVS